ncbi:permease [Amnibacterium sp.]|uniref:permease n=1 Tax=Amnibacterium sp. TaxID=1872496 RepID=UPI002633994E|nr:permease [Amnibacterium sp.]MCU1474671.1 rane protein [Amnibacterium sp.]
MGFVLTAIGEALAKAAAMGWQILWPLILGFALSAVVQAVVRRDRVARLLAGSGPRSVAIATGLGAASSSCSYAAVALARALFRRGASFTSAMAFEIASTNLVLELGLILAISLGWRFTLAEFVAGPLMIVLVALGFRLWLRGRIVERAREQAERGIPGSMEGHAGMDMSVAGDRPFLARLLSRDGVVSTSRYFVMDWAAVLRDIVIGLLIAGAFDAWVPRAWLRAVFLTGDPTAAFVLGPLIGPLIAVVSFVCSVGNVPLAAVLWNGGISFGGVMAFVFADLLILPILVIHRRYYGTRAMLGIAGTFYLAMALAGYVIEVLFTVLHLVPTERSARVLDAGISWDYTTWLDLLFLAVAVFLLVVFVRSGSWPMLGMMGGSPDAGHDHGHHDHGSAAAHPGHEEHAGHGDLHEGRPAPPA